MGMMSQNPAVLEWILIPSIIVEVATDPRVLIGLMVGSAIGVVVGVIPGLTGVMAMSLLLSYVFELPSDVGLAALLAIYAGAITAGSVSAILINIPGTVAAAATAIDGHALARSGQSREAIGLAFYSSFVGELFGNSLALLLLPIAGTVALLLGSWEVFLVAAIGMVVAGGVATGSGTKGPMVVLLGILVSTVGMDSIAGGPRFVFAPEMMSGISFVPVVIGLFGITEMLWVLKNPVPYVMVANPGRAIVPWSVILRLQQQW
jgi:putative tricarboxylic transport membrane protein